MSDKRIYTGIDLFKLIAAVLVVLLHAVETSAWYPCEVKFVFTRLAVPFFFIASGFFFFNGLDKAKNKFEYFRRYEKNILKLFIVWALIIYLPFTILNYIDIYHDAGPLKLSGLLFRRIFIIGAGPYWYLVALFWSALFLYLCYIRKYERLLLGGIIFGFFCMIIYSCFRNALSAVLCPVRIFAELIYTVFSWEFNFIMYGIPFMGLGYLFAKKKIKISINNSICILLVATILRIAEYNLPYIFPMSFWNDNSINIAFIFQAIAYFMMAMNLDFNIKKDTSMVLRQFSSCIYFSHAIFLYEILNPALLRYKSWNIYSGVWIPVKVIIVLLGCGILFGIVKKIDNKYLNILING